MYRGTSFLTSGMAGLLCLVFAVAACDRTSRRMEDHRIGPCLLPSGDEFSIMTYNLDRYGMHDRNHDGQSNNPKPGKEMDVIIAVIADAAPDILAVQEIGNPIVFDDFRARLEAAGLRYDSWEYLRRDDSEMNLAVLSRYPIVARQSKLDDEYRIGDEIVPVGAGFIDIDISINPSYSIRLLAAHLKSKVFHPLGQTEMRRNEARLLNKHVRHALAGNPRMNLIVVGTMNDRIDSAALREITGDRQEHLLDVRPADRYGGLWTYFDSEAERYVRYDYILLSQHAVPELVTEKTRILHQDMRKAGSSHRPLLAVFKSRNLPRQAPDR